MHCFIDMGSDIGDLRYVHTLRSKYEYVLKIVIVIEKSPIQVHPADPSTEFINSTTVAVYWNTTTPSENVNAKEYILQMTTNGTDMETIITGDILQSHFFSNILQGVQYSLRVAAVDMESRVGEMSQPIHFLFDGIVLLFPPYIT